MVSRLLNPCSRNGRQFFSQPRFSSQGLGLNWVKFRSYNGSKFSKDRIDITNVHQAPASRSPRDYLIPPAVLFIFGAGIWLIHSNDERRATSGSTHIKRFERNPQGIWPYGGPFKLVNTENKIVTEADLQGSWIIMYFGYTSSPDIGPEEAQKMAEAIEILENKHHVQITPVYITIDPQRDSPAQLRAYLQEFHPKIVGLTGPVAAIRQIAQEFRIFFKKTEEEGQDYLVESANDMILLNPETEIVGRFGVRYNAVQLADAIAKEVKKADR
ncbi:thioredoxin superfamily protein [Wolffia australiana]